VQRIESVPMTVEQHRDAVQALAALIIEWQKTRDSGEKQMNEARDQAA
jgi:hypothetical protein